jgi:hypothetical protein
LAGGISSTTSEDGSFILRLSPGAWTAVVEADGFLPDRARLTVSSRAPAPFLTLALASKARFQEQVEVTAPTEAAEANGPAELPVRPGDVTAVAGAGENVFRTLQTLELVCASFLL